jgi:putative ABC transport system permease protein
MLRHYLIVALRAFRRAPFLTLVKLLVLGLGLSCFVMAYSLFTYWRSAEGAFAKADRTYIMTTRIRLSDGSDTGAVPRLDQSFFEKMQLAFPDFETLARARAAGLMPVSAGAEKARLFAAYADAAVLEVFDLPFTTGSGGTALSEPRSAVLSEAAALELFGTMDAVGRTFTYGAVVDLTVTGVIGAIPQPSHLGASPSALLRFDVLASWDALEHVTAARRAANGGFGPGYPQLAYAVLPEGSRSTPESLATRLAPIGELEFERDLVRFTIGMLPIRNIVAKQLDSALFSRTAVSVSVSTLLLLLGVLVLAVASVNYVNLATAEAIKRAKEAGLRKAIGAENGQIVAQHLVEAALVTTLAFAAAVVVVASTAPMLRAVAGVDVALVFSVPMFWLVTSVAVTASALLAGAYPALVLSRARPLHALIPNGTLGGRRSVAALLVGVQFAVASFLLIAIFVMQQQAADLRRTGLATATDPLIMITNTSAFTGVESASLELELRALPSVRAVAGMSSPPWGDTPTVTLMTNARDPSSLRSVVLNGVDFEFFATMNVRLIAGRVFDPARDERSLFQYDFDNPSSVVIDEAFAREIGFTVPDRALDELVYLPVADTFQPARIIGVVANQALQFSDNGTVATVYHLDRRPQQLLVRLAKEDVPGALAAIRRVWEQRVPNLAFDYEFEDQLFAQGYAVFGRVSDAFGTLAALSYAICVIGLVGMAGHMAGRRRREIGVRKTLGATSRSVLGLLLAAFSRPVIVANLIAWPFAYLAAQAYLEIFIHRVALTPLPFAASLVVTLLVAWGAVVVQAWRAAHLPPAAALRHE